MSRLTQTSDKGGIAFTFDLDITCKPSEAQKILRLAEKLKQYEDAEEQGLLLRLPCREVFESSGDTVYYIFDHEIVECVNCGISIDCDGKIWIALACDEHIFPYREPIAEIDTDPTDWCTNSTEVTIDHWGKTVFPTEEEALKKLESEDKQDE